MTEEEIAKIISRWTGIPVAKLSESERQKTLNLDETLHKRVVGQDEAVTNGYRSYYQDLKLVLKIQASQLAHSYS